MADLEVQIENKCEEIQNALTDKLVYNGYHWHEFVTVKDEEEAEKRIMKVLTSEMKAEEFREWLGEKFDGSMIYKIAEDEVGMDWADSQVGGLE